MEYRPYSRRVNYYETDQMAIVHHSNYIRWFEEARLDFLDQVGFHRQNDHLAAVHHLLGALAGDHPQGPCGLLELFPALGAGAQLEALPVAVLQKALRHSLGHVSKSDKSQGALCHCAIFLSPL